MNFKDLGLDSALVNNLAKLGYSTPTPIQEKAIPLLLKGEDLMGIAATGTGKTAAFVLPFIQNLLKNKSERKVPRALILTPTRELCSQIQETVTSFGMGLGIESAAVFGGVSQDEQVEAIRKGVDIIVATPGRLLDLYRQKVLRIAGIEYFVMDEADRMLDMGFLDDLNEILDFLPVKKQNLLFSATMPGEMKKLSGTILSQPAIVEVAPAATLAKNIEQKLIYCQRNDKFQLLKKILKEEEIKLALVFTRTKVIADMVVEYLAQNRMASRALHGDKSQAERDRAITHFSEGAIKVLVATDIASRGIDIEGVSHVINFDLPLDAESYVHRIGRTARAGASGVAISFCDDTEKNLLDKIQELIQEYLPSEKFKGQPEKLKLKSALVKKVNAPTPGKSQEKNAWLDHSKRRAEDGPKRSHPGFKKTRKKRK